MQIASTDFYVKKLIESNPKFKGMIEIKKQSTYKRGVRSKVLVVYGLESDTNQVDTELVEKKYEGFRYMSYKKLLPS